MMNPKDIYGLLSRRQLCYLVALVTLSLILIRVAYSLIAGKPFGENILYFFSLNIPACVVIALVEVAVIDWLDAHNPAMSRGVRIAIDIVVTSVICFLMIVGMNWIIDGDSYMLWTYCKSGLIALPWNLIVVLQIELFMSMRRQAEIEKQQAIYQLTMLKRQINPHFLFNSLNVIASLAYQDPGKSNLFAKRLAGVYRYMLDTGERHEVEVDEEMAFVERYVYLEQIRFEGALVVDVSRDGVPDGACVIPASIQMLIENAVKHNVCNRDNPLRVDIVLDSSGVSVSNIVCRRKDVACGRRGLDNLMRQYALYGKKIAITDGERFTVMLPYINMRGEG